jgi:hypothetical protein
MDKNNIIINYYVDWKSSDWMKELFDQNGFDSSNVDWDTMFGGNPNKQVTPERAPSLNDNQRGI